MRKILIVLLVLLFINIAVFVSRFVYGEYKDYQALKKFERAMLVISERSK